MSALRPIAAALAAALLVPGAADAGVRSDFRPYIEAQQVVLVPLSGAFDSDAVTYTALAAGVDGNIETRRIQVGISYRYEHQFSWSDSYGDTDVHSGVARARLALVPNLLSLEAGGIATRTRVDIRGAAPAILTVDSDNITQVYGAYVGPTLVTRLGDLDVSAIYRFGYVHVDSKADLGLGPDQPRLNSYDSSTSHFAAASVGQRPGDLPFGWTASAGWQRENVRTLSQRFNDYYVRGDILFPVSPTLAVTAGAGYEWIRSNSGFPLIGSDGLPILDGNGRYRKDPNAPRLIAYDDTGIYYDAGVVWKPSPRTTLVATVGERYDQLAVTGSFSHRISPSSSVQVGVYNIVDSFGRSLNRNLSALPTNFTVPRNPFTNRVGGCVFSNDPRNGAGGCFDDSFQSLNAGDFRARGVFAVYSASRGPLRLGIGGGYAQRRYLTPLYVPFLGRAGYKDESLSAQANIGVTLSPRTSLENAIFVDWYKSGLMQDGDVVNGGATSSLYHNFTDRLVGSAALGVYVTDQEVFATDVSATALVGIRYQF